MKKYLYFTISFIIGFIVIEIIIFLMLMYPKIIPNFLLKYICQVYDDCGRIIQFEDKCSKYDKDLKYTLRPGKFIFSSYEFNNTFLVNSLGFRDDEESLNKPDIYCSRRLFCDGMWS